MSENSDVHRSLISASLAPFGRWNISCGEAFLLDGNGYCLASPRDLELAKPLVRAFASLRVVVLLDGKEDVVATLEHRVQERQSEDQLDVALEDEKTMGDIAAR